jgi:pimeloyl-ACP methyl ester carboxylesterase
MVMLMFCSRHRVGNLTASASAFALILLTIAIVPAQERLPRFEAAECPFERGDWAANVKLECGWLVASEVRERPQGRTVRLAVAILRAKEPNGDPPLVMLHGGPGDSGLRLFTPGVSRWPLALHRDIVIYDQRGAGFSQPKLCPEYRQNAARDLKTDREKETFLKNAARRCVKSLRAQGIEPAAYNTTASGFDLVDLRHVLGYSRWDVYGGSYGARLAQEAMRRDPSGIRSVVLESPMTRGPTFGAEFGLSFQRAVEHVFADCATSLACHAVFPNVEDDFYAVYAELAKTPLAVPVERSDEGSNTFELDSKHLVSLIHNQVIDRPARIAQLPLILSELRRGDKMRAAQTLVGYRNQPTGPGSSVSDALFWLVACFDIPRAAYRAAQKPIDSIIRPPFRIEEVDCKPWQKRFAEPSEYAPVKSDIPTLILAGRFDARTPVEHARLIAASLTKAYVYEFPNESHGQRPVGCHLQILSRFLENPFRDPDASCIRSIQSLRFITSWRELGSPP